MDRRRGGVASVAVERVCVGISGQQHTLEERSDTAHTDGAPPSCGSTILANTGCTENSISADGTASR